MSEVDTAPVAIDLARWQPQPRHLEQRVILITGAGEGIGRSVALACARQGATVVLLGETIRKLEEVYDEIEQAGAPQPAIYPMNLEGAAPKDYEDLALTLKGEFGRLDGIVHNAATLGTLAPIANYAMEQWYKVLQTNLHAPFLLTQACLGLLNASPAASLLFVSDEVGRRARAYWGAYAVSKSGLEALMQVLAAELESNTPIRVNSLDPGIVRTRMRTLAYPAENRDKHPLPDDVAPAFIFLLGPDGHQFTGRQFRFEAQTALLEAH